MIQNPIDDFNEQYKKIQTDYDQEELDELREREHTRWQLKSIAARLVGFFIKVWIAYWIFSLAYIGARELCRLDYAWIGLYTVLIYSSSCIWIIYEAMSTTIYNPIRENAYEGFEILGGKLKCAIKGWRECKVGEQ